MMKAVLPLQRAYEDQYEINVVLKARVDEIFTQNKEPLWHYVPARIKSLESFALKIETGRVFDPSKLEDFLACTLVVRNRKEIDKAVDLVDKFFTIIEKRPPDAHLTFKSPDSFPFDDLRLYLKLKRDTALPVTPIEDVLFELQIKTYLQHAWVIATHDLVYKSDEIDWGKARVAYHTKAMLEHVELAIEAAEDLSKSPLVAKVDMKTKQILKIKDTLLRVWSIDDLPEDLVRLCKTLNNFCTATGITIDEIEELIKAETEAGRGVNIKSLSPYLIIVSTLLQAKHAKLKTFLQKTHRGKSFVLVVPKDIEIPTEFNPIAPSNLRLV